MSNKQWIYNYFSDDELKEIQQAADLLESNTVGEIVLSFRNKRSLLEKLYSCHELALKDFETLGVYKCSERTGILIFIIFEEKYYDIIADESIYAKISNDTWNKMEEKQKEEFRSKNYSAGVLALIKEMGEVLSKEFPVRAGAANDDEIDREIVIN
ncbi:MAG TPA: TPM domain-containing protein [Ignavibacteria bacterium]|nr:TPM domain-containing protein [Ignavibacteria bacterium]